jgi:hypothetical protein
MRRAGLLLHVIAVVGAAILLVALTLTGRAEAADTPKLTVNDAGVIASEILRVEFEEAWEGGSRLKGGCRDRVSRSVLRCRIRWRNGDTRYDVRLRVRMESWDLYGPVFSWRVRDAVIRGA